MRTRKSVAKEMLRAVERCLIRRAAIDPITDQSKFSAISSKLDGMIQMLEIVTGENLIFDSQGVYIVTENDDIIKLTDRDL